MQNQDPRSSRINRFLLTTLVTGFFAIGVIGDDVIGFFFSSASQFEASADSTGPPVLVENFNDNALDPSLWCVFEDFPSIVQRQAPATTHQITTKRTRINQSQGVFLNSLALDSPEPSESLPRGLRLSRLSRSRFSGWLC